MCSRHYFNYKHVVFSLSSHQVIHVVSAQSIKSSESSNMSCEKVSICIQAQAAINSKLFHARMTAIIGTRPTS